jgi:hypothetical protein
VIYIIAEVKAATTSAEIILFLAYLSILSLLWKYELVSSEFLIPPSLQIWCALHWQRSSPGTCCRKAIATISKDTVDEKMIRTLVA